MSTSTAVMSFSGTLTDSRAESIANRLVPHGDETEICRLFQSAGSISNLITEVGGCELPYTFLSEGSKRFSSTSDPTWSIDPGLVEKLNETTRRIDDDTAREIMRPWGKSFVREIERAKAAGATAYRNSDPQELYERSMEDVLVSFRKLRSFVDTCSDRGRALLVCCYEDW